MNCPCPSKLRLLIQICFQDMDFIQSAINEVRPLAWNRMGRFNHVGPDTFIDYFIFDCNTFCLVRIYVCILYTAVPMQFLGYTAWSRFTSDRIPCVILVAWTACGIVSLYQRRRGLELYPPPQTTRVSKMIRMELRLQVTPCQVRGL